MSTHLLDEEKYIEDGYIDTSYFGGLLDAEISLFGYFEELYIDQNYFEFQGISFGLIAAADLLVLAESNTSSEFSANITADIILGFEVDTSSTFTVSADANLLVLAESSTSSEFTASVDGNKLTGFEVDTSSIFTVNAIADLLVLADSSISSEFSVAITADRIQEFGIVGSSEFSVSSTVEKILNAESNIDSSTAVIVSGDRIRTVDSAVAAEFTQTALIGAIRQGEVSVTGAFSPTLVATFLRLGDIDMASAFAISVAAQRIRDPNATTLANIINLSAQGNKLPGGEVAVTITANLTGRLDPLKLAEATVSAIFAAAITGRVVKGFAANFSSEFYQGTQIGNDFSTNVEAIFPLEADLSAATSTSVSGDRFRTTDIDFQSIATQMSVAGFLQSDIANLVSSFAITADVGAIRQGTISSNISATVEAAGGAVRPSASSMETTATQTITADAINGFAADLFSEFVIGHTDGLGFNSDVLPSIVKEFDATISADCTIVADLIKLVGNSILIESVASLVVEGTKTVEGSATISDAAIFQATIDITKLNSVDIAIISNLAAAGERIRNTGSVPFAVSGCVIDPSTVFDSSANFPLNVTITAVIGLLAISDDRTYKVPREYRLYAIPAENRTHKITHENRVYTIKGAA